MTERGYIIVVRWALFPANACRSSEEGRGGVRPAEETSALKLISIRAGLTINISTDFILKQDKVLHHHN